MEQALDTRYTWAVTWVAGFAKSNLLGVLLRFRLITGVIRGFRPGDVRHSLAKISRAKELLGAVLMHRIKEGLGESMDWYAEDLARAVV